MTRRRLAAGAALLFIGACVTTRLGVPIEEPIRVIGQPAAVPVDTVAAPTPRPEEVPRDETPDFRNEGRRDVRVALAVTTPAPGIAATGAWRLFEDRESVLLRGRPGEAWTLERRNDELRAVRTDGYATAWRPAPLVLRADRADDYLLYNGKRYRGVLRFHAADDGVGVMVVNALPVEQYLRGVVPLEIGGRTAAEQAAVEAQAVAARSYTFVRLAAAGGSAARHANYDVVASTADQVYGGADAERPFSDAAVASTAGLVLRYGGRTVDAPYSAACGGETASPDEVWRSGNQPYLRPVSDRIPGTQRYYCDPAPRFAWTRTLESDELDAALRQYLRNYTSVPNGGPGHATRVSVETRTVTGRVGLLRIETDGGRYAVRGNDVRYVLRAPGSEILNSTYFSVESETGPGGALRRLVIRGNGWGHGIGMCQWGAIGRARAGQDFRTILRTYYPGTELGPAS
ncbi:MAG TPA: SpoIID/LytB domain-containing protein [Gemmatimonadaceae bacterium]